MPEQQLLRTPLRLAKPGPPCYLARAHNARATRRPHDGTARCRRHHAVPPTAEPPPRCSLPAARRPASLSLPCDDFHTALATLAHRRRLPHAVAQHYAVPPLAVPPPCSHHCAQARQPRCRVTRIVNSAVISATPRCTPTPASCPATVATIDGGRLEPRAAAAPLAYKRQGRVALHRHDELSPSHPTPPALLALLLHKETSLLSISSCRQPRTKVSSCRAAPQHPRPSQPAPLHLPATSELISRGHGCHAAGPDLRLPCSKLSNRNPLALLFLPVCSVSCIVARAIVRQAGEARSASHGGRA